MLSYVSPQKILGSFWDLGNAQKVRVPPLFINGCTVTTCCACKVGREKVWTHGHILFSVICGPRRIQWVGLGLAWRHVSWQEVLLFEASLTLTGVSCLWTVPWSSPNWKKGLRGHERWNIWHDSQHRVFKPCCLERKICARFEIFG